MGNFVEEDLRKGVKILNFQMDQGCGSGLIMEGHGKQES
jgi:hypothetical protein